jgi:hypothetical protein
MISFISGKVHLLPGFSKITLAVVLYHAYY